MTVIHSDRSVVDVQYAFHIHPEIRRYFTVHCNGNITVTSGDNFFLIELVIVLVNQIAHFNLHL